ncbi:MAG: DUF1080 domain-containing protein [Pedosphaera sp.]|nr:DUF1080 domain-containing protein [Pedosphaera sp.]MSU44125.1 DUF1080 domain-containing protein [Pedosphaera sp.]
MTHTRPLLCVLAMLVASTIFAADHNTLTEAEKREGWLLLFDGKDFNAHWRNIGKDRVAPNGWVAKDGSLIKPAGVKAGDIITQKTWTDFEFSWEWKIGPKGNNGVKYMILEKRGAIGHEYQMIDDTFHKEPLGATGSFYAVLPAKADKPLKPVGQWNHSLIKVQGKAVEHWLNGERILSYELGSAPVLEGVAKSKFKNYSSFGTKVTGHILLTDHGDECAFRNLKAREPKAR